MITIYKYPLPVPYGLGEFRIALPRDAEILDIQAQGEESTVYLWACVDTRQPISVCNLFGVGTGKPLPLPGEAGCLERYIATRHFMGGRLVVHYFEQVLTEPSAAGR